MRGKGIVKQMWEIFSPLILRYAVAYVVALFFLDAYSEHPTEMGAVAALLTIPFLAWMMKKDGPFAVQKATAGMYVWIVGISAAVAVGLNNMLMLIQIERYSEAYRQAAETLYSPAFLVQLVCVGIIYPIMEEYIFRGIIYRRMRAASTPKKAMVVSSVFFGLYHGNLVQMVYGTVAGLLLTYVYEKYGSLKAPILAHITMNIVACVLTEMNGFAWMFAQPIRVALITSLCIVLAFVILSRMKKMGEITENL